MSYKVTVLPSNRVFEVGENEYILDAALQAGLAFPYGCRGGACGACIGKIVRGEHYYEEPPIGLCEDDTAQQLALFCKAKPKSDLEIEVKQVTSANEITVKTLPCRVVEMDKLAPDVMRLKLKLPTNERLQFLPGQYIDILLRDGRKRSFSLAIPPHDDELLELHIRRVDNGFYTKTIFEEMKVKTLLRIEGPHGSFTVDEESNRPIIFIGGGTGFAPIKSILEHLFAENTEQEFIFYWGARNEELLYLHELVGEWQNKHDNFKYIPVLSDVSSESKWQGRTGLVHKAVTQDFSDLSSHDIYACGPPPMIEAVNDEFLNYGMDKNRFFSDAFTLAGD